MQKINTYLKLIKWQRTPDLVEVSLANPGWQVAFPILFA